LLASCLGSHPDSGVFSLYLLDFYVDTCVQVDILCNRWFNIGEYVV
jgi:hypothetical protein